MAKIGLFYGSNTGKTEAVAYQIKDEFDKHGAGLIDVHNIGSTTKDQMLQYSYLIMGIPTWNTGELQDDWDVFLPNFRDMNMSGKHVAIFGLGDQNGYGFNFLDAAGILANEVLMTGATLYGLWSNEKYQFNESKARQDEYFLCLGVDQEGQENMTAERISQWVKSVKEEFGI